jgi:hypothetical protein
MLQMRLIMTFATGVISLASCGYPLPEAVEIFVNTFPPDASCVVSRGGQTANVDVTPGIALVPNEEADYLVACRRNGYQEAAAVVHARAQRRGTLEFLGGQPDRASSGASVTFVLRP